MRIAALVMATALAGCTGIRSPRIAAGLPRAVTATLAVPPGEGVSSVLNLVKPHFRATTASGELQPVAGTPEEVVVHEGRVKIRLRQHERVLFLDPLALQSTPLGEHPRHKIERLHENGIPLHDGLAASLTGPQADELFHTLTFEYLPGSLVTGVITEVFADGTFLVLPCELPPEWRSDDPGTTTPSHLHVDPRALSGPVSVVARELEQELLVLPFEEQRYPPVPLARRLCRIYHDSRQQQAYRDLLREVGLQFAAGNLADESSDEQLGHRLQTLLRASSGPGTTYFGYESRWLAGRLHELGAPWLGECDTAYGLAGLRETPASPPRYSLVVHRPLQPDRHQRYRIVTLGSNGSAAEVYAAPGIVLLAQPMPWDQNTWMLSCEGWPGPETDSDTPADPRWQAVYLVHSDDPEQYTRVPFPLARFANAPPSGLYGGSPLLSSDLRYLYLSLYGFSDEGGGLWLVDVSSDRFADQPRRFVRILEWDHLLSWFVLAVDTTGDAPLVHLFVTGKEVADDFAMTANVVTLRGSGSDRSVTSRQRLARMVGWNPVPFLLQHCSPCQLLIGVETHFNYESSLLPRAKGVFLLTVNLAECNSPIDTSREAS